MYCCAMRTTFCALAAVSVVLAIGACGESSQDKAKNTVCDARGDISKQIDALKGLGDCDQGRRHPAAERDQRRRATGHRPARSRIAARSSTRSRPRRRHFESSISRPPEVPKSLSASDAKAQLTTAVQQLEASYTSTLARVDWRGCNSRNLLSFPAARERVRGVGCGRWIALRRNLIVPSSLSFASAAFISACAWRSCWNRRGRHLLVEPDSYRLLPGHIAAVFRASAIFALQHGAAQTKATWFLYAARPARAPWCRVEGNARARCLPGFQAQSLDYRRSSSSIG